ncbi:uncharacterized protein [Amphiura filiformis]|uniref:uncharacterized protein isoform X2 n=1 Tax=Amphiura filiformis TaxID=82378 RepID=UPI003B226E75
MGMLGVEINPTNVSDIITLSICYEINNGKDDDQCVGDKTTYNEHEIDNVTAIKINVVVDHMPIVDTTFIIKLTPYACVVTALGGGRTTEATTFPIFTIPGTPAPPTPGTPAPPTSGTPTPSTPGTSTPPTPGTPAPPTPGTPGPPTPGTPPPPTPGTPAPPTPGTPVPPCYEQLSYGYRTKAENGATNGKDTYTPDFNIAGPYCVTIVFIPLAELYHIEFNPTEGSVSNLTISYELFTDNSFGYQVPKSLTLSGTTLALDTQGNDLVFAIRICILRIDNGIPLTPPTLIMSYFGCYSECIMPPTTTIEEPTTPSTCYDDIREIPHLISNLDDVTPDEDGKMCFYINGDVTLSDIVVDGPYTQDDDMWNLIVTDYNNMTFPFTEPMSQLRQILRGNMIKNVRKFCIKLMEPSTLTEPYSLKVYVCDVVPCLDASGSVEYQETNGEPIGIPGTFTADYTNNIMGAIELTTSFGQGGIILMDCEMYSPQMDPDDIFECVIEYANADPYMREANFSVIRDDIQSDASSNGKVVLVFRLTKVSDAKGQNEVETYEFIFRGCGIVESTTTHPMTPSTTAEPCYANVLDIPGRVSVQKMNNEYNKMQGVFMKKTTDKLANMLAIFHSYVTIDDCIIKPSSDLWTMKVVDAYEGQHGINNASQTALSKQCKDMKNLPLKSISFERISDKNDDKAVYTLILPGCIEGTTTPSLTTTPEYCYDNLRDIGMVKMEIGGINNTTWTQGYFQTSPSNKAKDGEPSFRTIFNDLVTLTDIDIILVDVEGHIANDKKDEYSVILKDNYGNIKFDIKKGDVKALLKHYKQVGVTEVRVNRTHDDKPGADIEKVFIHYKGCAYISTTKAPPSTTSPGTTPFRTTTGYTFGTETTAGQTPSSAGPTTTGPITTTGTTTGYTFGTETTAGPTPSSAGPITTTGNTTGYTFGTETTAGPTPSSAGPTTTGPITTTGTGTGLTVETPTPSTAGPTTVAVTTAESCLKQMTDPLPSLTVDGEFQDKPDGEFCLQYYEQGIVIIYFEPPFDLMDLNLLDMNAGYPNSTINDRTFTLTCQRANDVFIQIGPLPWANITQRVNSLTETLTSIETIFLQKDVDSRSMTPGSEDCYRLELFGCDTSPLPTALPSSTPEYCKDILTDVIQSQKVNGVPVDETKGCTLKSGDEVVFVFNKPGNVMNLLLQTYTGGTPNGNDKWSAYVTCANNIHHEIVQTETQRMLDFFREGFQYVKLLVLILVTHLPIGQDTTLRIQLEGCIPDTTMPTLPTKAPPGSCMEDIHDLQFIEKESFGDQDVKKVFTEYPDGNIQFRYQMCFVQGLFLMDIDFDSHNINYELFTIEVLFEDEETTDSFPYKDLKQKLGEFINEGKRCLCYWITRTTPNESIIPKIYYVKSFGCETFETGPTTTTSSTPSDCPYRMGSDLKLEDSRNTSAAYCNSSLEMLNTNPCKPAAGDSYHVHYKSPIVPRQIVCNNNAAYVEIVIQYISAGSTNIVTVKVIYTVPKGGKPINLNINTPVTDLYLTITSLPEDELPVVFLFDVVGCECAKHMDDMETKRNVTNGDSTCTYLGATCSYNPQGSNVVVELNAPTYIAEVVFRTPPQKNWVRRCRLDSRNSEGNIDTQVLDVPAPDGDRQAKVLVRIFSKTDT